MFITVSELLKLDIFADAVLMAGAGGLERHIRRVTVAEVPDIVNWVRGGELILTSGFALRQDAEAQQNFVERMALAGISAIAIKPERFLGKIPEGMITQADTDGIPLIQMPAEIPWTDISTAVHDRLLDKQVQTLKRSEEVQRELTTRVLEAGGSSLTAIALALASLTGHIAVIEDGSLNLLTGKTPTGEEFCPQSMDRAEDIDAGRQAMLEKLRAITGHGRIPETFYGGHTSRVAALINIRQRCSGYISVLEDEEELPDVDHIILEHAATAAALEMVRQESVSEAERRMRCDLWDELLSGNIQTVESIASRADALGCDINGSYLAVVVMPDLEDESLNSQPLAQTIQLLIREIRDRWPGPTTPILLDRSDSVIILRPVPEEFKLDTVRQEMEKLRHRLEKELPSLELSIGVGGYYGDILRLYRSHLEARKAVQMGRRLHGRSKNSYYDDMGGYRLLFNYPDRNRVAAFMKEIIGELIDYDESHNTELVYTLKTYFDCGESIKLAAERLFIHRHTLEYRLGQILSLTGADLKSPEDQLNLRMSVAICDLLGGK